MKPPARARSGASEFWLLWGLLLAAKLALAAALPLFGDEAFYWWESRHPAWAYSDLPGLTAWLIGLGVAVGGDTPLGLRWPFLLIGAACPLLVVDMARRITDARAGWRAGTWSLLLPLLALLGVLALPDVPMTFAGLLCVAAIMALRRRVTAGAVLVLALGLVVGALAHYRFVLLIGAGLAGVLLDPRSRALLGRPAVWAALAAGLLAWLPLLRFNLAHGGAGLQFQLVDRHPWALQAEGLAHPLLQAIVVTPLLYGLLLAVLWQAWRRRDDDDAPWRFVLGCSGALLAGLWLAALFADSERVSFHWPLVGYLPLIALLPRMDAAFPRWLRGAAAGLAAAGTLVLGLVLAATCSSEGRAWLAERRVYPDNFGGWDAAVQLVRAQLASAPENAVVVADTFMLAAQLSFAFAGEGREVYSLVHPLNRKHGRALQLRIWERDIDALAGRPIDIVLVIEDGSLRARDRLAWYHTLCHRIDHIGPFASAYADHGAKRFLVADARSGQAGHCAVPALAWIDAPARGAVLDGDTEVLGWAFKDGAGVEELWVTFDGVPVARAEYGEPAPHVAGFWRVSTDPAHPRVGFRAVVPAERLPAGDHALGLLVVGADGSRERIAEQPVRIVR